MTLRLNNKKVLLGVTGSIAAYKSPDIVRRLREAGASVRVVMTQNASRFITPLTLQAVSGFPVHNELFDLEAEAAMGHIELARWADIVLIAPATADFIAKIANGQADDLLTSICLATKSRLVIAPAMNQGMWSHASTQANIATLKQKQLLIAGPAEGSQACGDVGLGRMLEPSEIVAALSQVFETGALAGKKVLITAGPTHEHFDPVRYVTNGSSGKMGYALAEAAYEAGASVTLVSGPVTIDVPDGVICEQVTTAREMHAAVMRNIQDYDIFLAVAAVSDYRPETQSDQKIHKSETEMSITLVRNPDIAAEVGQLSPKPFIVGFAAETERVVEQAAAKRQRKKMDLIIANLVGSGVGMGSNENEVTIIGDNFQQTLPLMSKVQLARELIPMIVKQFNGQKK